MFDDDPRLWLEELDSAAALTWVKQQNESTIARYASSDAFADAKAKLVRIYNSKEKIPHVRKRGHYCYNLWRDPKHRRGLWRRTTLNSWKTDEPQWDTILDLDALNRNEKENWVWKGASFLSPNYERCLVHLSRGGADATEIREFDVEQREFVADGFYLPESKNRLYWIDDSATYVGTDFGKGSLTASGYPRIAKRWQRGTPLAHAELVFEGERSDVAVVAWRHDRPGSERDLVRRTIKSFNTRVWEVTQSGLQEFQKPLDAAIQFFKRWVLLRLRSDWQIDGKRYNAGSVIVADCAEFKAGRPHFDVLFEPSETCALRHVFSTRDQIVLAILDNVNTRIRVLSPSGTNWQAAEIDGLPAGTRVTASPVDARQSNDLWLNVSGYLTPSSVWIKSANAAPQRLKQSRRWFDDERFVVEQFFATSNDGTRVPYFQIGTKDVATQGGAPTLLYGYGGFEVSKLPAYQSAVGVGWLERGGVYVVANIRGGGEFGPRWHQSALRENRHRAYDDFLAVAKDLIERGVTTPQTLGIRGGSNGGLLVGNMYTQYPQYFGAVVCAVPLLDMRRYHKLHAGASWMAEYGDPDIPQDWAFIKTFSPYHNINPDVQYPPLLLTTSTRDDRVHPAHARKMAHALQALNKDVSFYENVEGGHGGAADLAQSSFMTELGYTFMWQNLNK